MKEIEDDLKEIDNSILVCVDLLSVSLTSSGRSMPC